MDDKNKSETRVKPQWGLMGAIAAAVAASICCVGPFVLLALGISGAWISSLTAFEPYRPVFMAVTFLFLGFAFYKVYRKPKAEECAAGSYCADPRSDRINKMTLWIITVLIGGLLIFPNIAPSIFAGSGTTEIVQTQQITLDVKGMTCAMCPITVKKVLTSLDGVKEANVTLDPPEAFVRYDPSKLSIEKLTEATTNAGYPSSLKGGK